MLVVLTGLPCRGGVGAPGFELRPVSTMVFIDILKTHLDTCGSRPAPALPAG